MNNCFRQTTYMELKHFLSPDLHGESCSVKTNFGIHEFRITDLFNLYAWLSFVVNSLTFLNVCRKRNSFGNDYSIVPIDFHVVNRMQCKYGLFFPSALHNQTLSKHNNLKTPTSRLHNLKYTVLEPLLFR